MSVYMPALAQAQVIPFPTFQLKYYRICSKEIFQPVTVSFLFTIIIITIFNLFFHAHVT